MTSNPFLRSVRFMSFYYRSYGPRREDGVTSNMFLYILPTCHPVFTTGSMPTLPCFGVCFMLPRRMGFAIPYRWTEFVTPSTCSFLTKFLMKVRSGLQTPTCIEVLQRGLVQVKIDCHAELVEA